MVDESRKTKDRSPNFPFISLETAVRRAHEFYQGEKRGVAPIKVAAKHWNYSPSSSGALQTMAALKNYGLMSDEGSGEQRKVRLTELALRILLDSRPDSLDRLHFLRRAALNPQIAADVYEQWPDNLPSESNLHHYLVFDRKFNDETAKKVVKIIYENEILTAVHTSGSQSDSSKIESDKPVSEVRLLPAPTASTVPELRPGTEHIEMIPAPGATIKLIFSGEPTYQTLEYLEKYLALRKSFLKKPDPRAEAEE